MKKILASVLVLSSLIVFGVNVVSFASAYGPFSPEDDNRIPAYGPFSPESDNRIPAYGLFSPEDDKAALQNEKADSHEVGGSETVVDGISYKYRFSDYGVILEEIAEKIVELKIP